MKLYLPLVNMLLHQKLALYQFKTTGHQVISCSALMVRQTTTWSANHVLLGLSTSHSHSLIADRSSRRKRTVLFYDAVCKNSAAHNSSCSTRMNGRISIRKKNCKETTEHCYVQETSNLPRIRESIFGG